MKEDNSQNQLLTLQKMRDLEKEIDMRKEEQQSIKDIIKVDNVELTPMLKLKEAYIVKLEDERKQLSYQLYTEDGLIGVSNEEGLIELTPEYIAQMNDKLGQYGAEYMILAQGKELDPKQLEEQSLEPYRQSNLEAQQIYMREQLEEQGNSKDRDKEDNSTTMDKMEEDLGCDITSCVRIEDERFSDEVLGYQTGHTEKYIGYSKSRNTFILIGQKGNKFEEIQDICGAQGSGVTSQTHIEYDENGNPHEEKSPSFVMQRRDGKEGGLAIDMHYGAICVSNLVLSDKEEGKLVKEELYVGHSIKPSPDEVEAERLREDELEKQRRAIQERQREQDDDDDYDWSEGRPMPKH